jgi:hypothetical protein
MLPTRRARIALVAVVSIILTPFLGDVSQAAECRIAPIKPIRCVRGIVTDPSGLPISNAKVTILRAGTEFVSIRTNTDGKFSFDRLGAGDYEVQVEEKGFKTARSPITVVTPASRCKWALRVVLGFGMECDTGIAVVKSKATQ